MTPRTRKVVGVLCLVPAAGVTVAVCVFVPGSFVVLIITVVVLAMTGVGLSLLND